MSLFGLDRVTMVRRWPFLYRAMKPLGNMLLMYRWKRNGRQGAPPPAEKHRIIKEYAERFGIGTLVETGTYWGDTVDAVEDEFDRIYSVEFDDFLFGQARRRFSRNERITILHGDSADILPKVLAEVDGPCLFWLDAHCSGGMTGKGPLLTPIVDELRTILGDRPDHVVLADDASAFVGDDDYPTLDQVRELVRAHRPEWAFEVDSNIIRAHPRVTQTQRPGSSRGALKRMTPGS